MVNNLQDDMIRGDMADEFAAFPLEWVREAQVPQLIAYIEGMDAGYWNRMRSRMFIIVNGQDLLPQKLTIKGLDWLLIEERGL